MTLDSKKLLNHVLDYIEKIGNKLPHPATLFAIFALIVVLLSWWLNWASVEAIHPADKSIIKVNSLLSGDGVRWMYKNIVDNFVNFPPLGLVLAIMIGIGLAEGTGLLNSIIRACVLNRSKMMVTASLVFAGVVSHVASEAGYVILIPLGAAVFYALGRHPMAGLAAAFCGVSGGFGANFLIASVDPILAGLSQSAAQIIDPTMKISPAVTFYFSFVSAILVVIVGTWITEKIVEPRLGQYTGNAEKPVTEQISPLEKKGLLWAAGSLVLTIVLLLLTIVPENGILRDPKSNSVLTSPFFSGMATGILLFFFMPALVYGIVVGTIKNDKDLIKHIVKSMTGLSSYIVLVFFAAQFVAFFKYSNLGLILAIQGAEFLKNIQFTGIPLIIAFVFVCAFINLFMGSASAKWAVMAPVFVPMFMLLDYHPALTQAAFRIGDSVTNIITPMMSYFALIVAFSQKYDEKYGIGTIIAMMIPYTFILTICWILLLMVWMLLGLPLGPDGPLYLH